MKVFWLDFWRDEPRLICGMQLFPIFLMLEERLDDHGDKWKTWIGIGKPDENEDELT